MKYPMDPATFIESVNQLLEHNKMQENVINRVCGLLKEAMNETENVENDWYAEAETLFKDLHALKMYHESRRFNEDNFRNQFGFEPKQRVSESIERLNDPAGAPSFEPSAESIGEMSEDELSKFFSDARIGKRQRSKEKSLKQMSMNEIDSTPVNKLKELMAKATVEEMEADNSNDIYKIKARVANLARGPGMSLTPQGTQLCNVFVHVLKSLYDFAERIPDENIKNKLTKLIRSHENMPGTLIAAAGAGVVQSEKDKDKV